MIPPISPFGLIQEHLWPDGWKVLVCCLMLNRTKREQVEKIIGQFFVLFPTPQKFSEASRDIVINLIKPLGFYNQRYKNLLEMTLAFLKPGWVNAGELPGVGPYANAAYEIFCKGNLPIEPPNDHALKSYVIWCNKHHRCLNKR